MLHLHGYHKVMTFIGY